MKKTDGFPEHDKLNKERINIIALLRFMNFLRDQPVRPIQDDPWVVYDYLEIDRVKLADERLEALRRVKL